MRRLAVLVSLFVTGMATAGGDMQYSGLAGWTEVEQGAEARGMLHFQYTSRNWAAEGYHSYSSPFSLALNIKSGRDMDRFCEEFSWLSAPPSCPPAVTVSGTIYFSETSSPLEGGGIWREGDLIGWMSCAKDNSSCTLNFEGQGETPWFEVKITFNEDRSVKFLSGAVYRFHGMDEYYLVWHSKNLSN